MLFGAVIVVGTIAPEWLFREVITWRPTLLDIVRGLLICLGAVVVWMGVGFAFFGWKLTGGVR